MTSEAHPSGDDSWQRHRRRTQQRRVLASAEACDAATRSGGANPIASNAAVFVRPSARTDCPGPARWRSAQSIIALGIGRAVRGGQRGDSARTGDLRTLVCPPRSSYDMALVSPMHPAASAQTRRRPNTRLSHPAALARATWNAEEHGGGVDGGGLGRRGIPWALSGARCFQRSAGICSGGEITVRTSLHRRATVADCLARRHQLALVEQARASPPRHMSCICRISAPRVCQTTRGFTWRSRAELAGLPQPSDGCEARRARACYRRQSAMGWLIHSGAYLFGYGAAC